MQSSFQKVSLKHTHTRNIFYNPKKIYKTFPVVDNNHLPSPLIYLLTSSLTVFFFFFCLIICMYVFVHLFLSLYIKQFFLYLIVCLFALNTMQLLISLPLPRSANMTLQSRQEQSRTSAAIIMISMTICLFIILGSPHWSLMVSDRL